MFFAACLVDSDVELLATYMRGISMVCLDPPGLPGIPRGPLFGQFFLQGPHRAPQELQGSPGDPFLVSFFTGIPQGPPGSSGDPRGALFGLFFLQGPYRDPQGTGFGSVFVTGTLQGPPRIPREPQGIPFGSVPAAFDGQLSRRSVNPWILFVTFARDHPPCARPELDLFL